MEAARILTVTRTLIKARLGIEDTLSDSAIDACIAAQTPAYEAGVDPDLLANAAYLDTLNAAANDWIAGEFAAQRIRAEGMNETICIDGIEIKPYVRDVNDPTGLKTQAGTRILAVSQRNLSSRSLAGLPAEEIVS